MNMRGSLWQCSQLQCKLATAEESRGLEVQNQLLDDLKAEFQEFPRRRVYMPNVPLITSPPPSIPEIDSESQHSLREAFQSEIASSSVFHSFSSPLNTDRTYREVSSLQRTLAAEAEKQVQTLGSERRLEDHQQDSKEHFSEERIARKTLSNQARDRHHEVVEEPPTQRPRLENPASAIR